ncbi:hypothetical protein BGW38_009011 [Lunasporangiospora selenospora]|uniref:Uncharacterized protein n=1 Tax=Lunasporangiospora selenospora TaxID=979761 RepID=A0A9P6FZN5_9FUNG|nr:hypothetical protein BGW38_009011 [Lunasporangiospora selenospora]
MVSFNYGYAMSDVPGDKRIVTPPMLGDKISLSLGHTSTFVFIGTKAEILEWFKTVGAHKVLQTTVFHDRPGPQLDLIFDLFYYPNPDMSWTQYYQSFYKSDPTLEVFRLEIRPEQPKIDSELEPLCRVYSKSGVTLEEMAPLLEKRWAEAAAKSYVEMATEMFYEREDVKEHSEAVTKERKRQDEDGQEVELNDIVVTVPNENRP